MIDKSGLVVYHPNANMVLKENLLQNSNTALRDITQKMVEGRQGKAFYQFQGENKLLAYDPAGQFSVAMTIPCRNNPRPHLSSRIANSSGD